MSLIKLENVSKRFNVKKALDDVSLNIEKGRIVGLLGSNGSGKTTIIKLINDLIQPTSGKVFINGMPPGIASKKIISYLPERTYLSSQLKVQDILKYFSDFYNDFDESHARQLLKDFEIDEKERLKNMSKGMKEKVQLILTMSRKAQLYILDEPIGGVDPASRDYILDTILANFNENATIIISTHLISDIERVLDDVIFISKGKITKQCEADVLRSKKGMSIDEIFREEFKCL